MTEYLTYTDFKQKYDLTNVEPLGEIFAQAITQNHEVLATGAYFDLYKDCLQYFNHFRKQNEYNEKILNNELEEVTKNETAVKLNVVRFNNTIKNLEAENEKLNNEVKRLNDLSTILQNKYNKEVAKNKNYNQIMKEKRQILYEKDLEVQKKEKYKNMITANSYGKCKAGILMIKLARNIGKKLKLKLEKTIPYNGLINEEKIFNELRSNLLELHQKVETQVQNEVTNL